MILQLTKHVNPNLTKQNINHIRSFNVLCVFFYEFSHLLYYVKVVLSLLLNISKSRFIFSNSFDTRDHEVNYRRKFGKLHSK